MSSQLAERIVHVPELYEHSDKSTAVLLKEAGLPDAPAPPSAPEIEDALKKEPELTDLWLQRGHDQLYAGGWAIECSDHTYHIRNYADGQSLTEQNRFKACAEFIARYVSVVREVLRHEH
jgi:hypothetical protein